MFNKKSCIEKEINFKLKTINYEHFCEHVTNTLYSITEEHEINRIYDAMFRIKPTYYVNSYDFFDDYREVLILIDQYCFENNFLELLNIKPGAKGLI